MIELIYYTNGPNKGRVNWEKTCPTIKEVQELINEKQLTHAEFRDQFNGLRSRCRDKDWTKDLVFRKVKEDWSSYNTIESVQSLITENNLSNAKFSKKYCGLYQKCLNNGWIKNLKFSKTIINRSNTMDEVQKIISKENLSHREFIENYPELHKKYIEHWHWTNKITFREDEHQWDSYSKEDVQGLLNNNRLTENRFKLIYPELYDKCINEIWIDSLKFRAESKDWSSWTLEKTQELITKENLGYCEFKEKYVGLCNKCTREGWTSQLTFKEINKKWDDFDSLEKVQEFINENNLSPSDFHDKYPGLYRRSRFFDWYELLVFPNRKSRMENHFDDLYPIKSYPMIKRDSYELHWLKTDYSPISMRPDVLIDTDNVKLVIEFQGDQHFYMSEYMHKTDENYQKMIERDELKYKLLTEHDFTVIYFVDYNLGQYVINHFPEKFEPGGYIGGTTIITSWDELKFVVDKALGKI